MAVFGSLVSEDAPFGAAGGVDPQTAFNSLRSSETGDDAGGLGDVQSAFSSQKSLSVGNSERGIIEGLPGPPLDLKALIVKARFVILSWKPPLENPQNVEAYSIFCRQEGSDR